MFWLLLGNPDVAYIFLAGLAVGLFRLVYDMQRPTRSGLEPGWRMDPTGNYRWWNGSELTDPPPGETPRKIGPEIEW
jgi:hypothetical protein